MDKRKLQNIFTALNVAEKVVAAKRQGKSPINPDTALSAFFSRRFSSPESFAESLDSLIYLSRKDLPELSSPEEVYFPSGQNALHGYLYRADLAKGLILYVHGLMGSSEDKYAIPQAYFLRKGYDVLAIDLTASGRSEGLGVKGLHQSAVDVYNAYGYIKSRADLSGLRLCFFGHSWGGYGVCAALGLGARPAAVAEISGFDSPLKEMMGLPQEKLGMDLSFGKEELELALRERAGELYDLSAGEGVVNARIPTLLVHGEDDATVPLKGVSIYDNVPMGLSHVTHLLRPHTGHMDIFFDPMAVDYANQVKEMGKSMIASYGKRLSDVPAEAVEEYTRRFSPALCSALNLDLFDRVDAFFAAHL